MAITITWEGGASSPTLFPSGSYIGFYGSTFNSSIPLDGYNTTTSITNVTSTVNYGALPNIQYTTPGYAIWNNPTKGTVSGSIDGASFGDMTLHIRITSGSAVRLSSVNLVAYQGPDITTGPTDAVVVGFEQGSTDWTVMDGLASPLALTPHTASGSAVHDYYVGLAVSPTTTLANTTISFGIVSTWY